MMLFVKRTEVSQMIPCQSSHLISALVEQCLWKANIKYKGSLWLN